MTCSQGTLFLRYIPSKLHLEAVLKIRLWERLDPRIQHTTMMATRGMGRHTFVIVPMTSAIHGLGLKCRYLDLKDVIHSFIGRYVLMWQGIIRTTLAFPGSCLLLFMPTTSTGPESAASQTAVAAPSVEQCHERLLDSLHGY